MKYKILVLAVCILIIVLIQSTILELIKINGIKPNLLIVFIISAALLRGNTEGAVVGFFLGLAQDIATGKVIGFYALLGLFLGLAAGSVNRRLYRENFMVIILFTFIFTVSYEFAVFFLNTFTFDYTKLLFSLRYVILPEAVYNCFASIFIYVIVIKLNDRLAHMDKSRKY